MTEFLASEIGMIDAIVCAAIIAMVAVYRIIPRSRKPSEFTGGDFPQDHP